MSEGAELAYYLERAARRRRLEAPAPVTVILGSSRRAGNTARLVDAVFRHVPAAQIIDLSDHDIAPYDYGNRHEADDFLNLARTIAQSEAVVFATPVYWYAMSAQLKTFFDRLSDLTRVHKPIGRSLSGKAMFLITTSAEAALPDGFETPFRKTARYLDMHYLGNLHADMRGDRTLTPSDETAAAAFAEKIAAALKTARAA